MKGITIQGELNPGGYTIQYRGAVVTIDNIEIGKILSEGDEEGALVNIPEFYGLLIDILGNLRDQEITLKRACEIEASRKYMNLKRSSLANILDVEGKAAKDNGIPADSFVDRVLESNPDMVLLRSAWDSTSLLIRRVQDTVGLIDKVWEATRSLNANARALMK